MTTTAAAANTASPIVSGTTALPAGTSSTSAAAKTNTLATQQIAGNFQSFLQLLTTQLQNQNPLSPLDTNQFTQQLVEFAGVQQQLNTNDSLATLVSLQQTAQSTQALGFVGKTAVVNGSTAPLTATSSTTNEAVWLLSVPSASTLSVTITGSNGQTVFSGPYNATAGNSQPFTWDGQGNDGTQYPAGSYTLTAIGK